MTGASHRGEEGHLPQVAKARLPGCHLSKCSFLLCCGLRTVGKLLFSFGHFFNQEGLGRCGTSQQSWLSEASLPAGRRGAGVTRKVINHENYDDADEKLLFPPTMITNDKGDISH